MEGNPYKELVSIVKNGVREEKESGYYFGEVASEKPVKIKVSDIEYKGDDLKKAQGLTLEKGDEVLLLPFEEKQKMVILCKVVNV